MCVYLGASLSSLGLHPDPRPAPRPSPLPAGTVPVFPQRAVLCCFCFFESVALETSLVVQWLKIHLPI